MLWKRFPGRSGQYVPELKAGMCFWGSSLSHPRLCTCEGVLLHGEEAEEEGSGDIRALWSVLLHPSSELTSVPSLPEWSQWFISELL